MQDQIALGQSFTCPPTQKRINLLGWICAGAMGGLVLSTLTLVAVWRPLIGLPLAPGTLGQHAAHWAMLAAHLVSRSLFASEAADYATFLAKCNVGERGGLFARVLLAALAFVAPWVALAPAYLRPRDGLIYLRGAQRFEGKAALSELRSRLRLQCLRRPDHDIAPGVQYPADMWTRHVLVVGGVGSGKSTAMKPLIDKIVASGEQMLLFDPKSEFTIGWSRPAIVAPWDARSLAWDLARDMRNALDMRRFAAALVRESHDPMWSNASRQLLVGLMLHLKATRGDDWGWRELAQLVALPQPQLRPIMEAHHPEALCAVEKASVTTAGILINLSSFCASLFDLARAWGDAPRDRRISFVEWTHGRSRWPQIIVQGHGAYGELTKSYVEGVVGVVSAIVNSVEMRDDPRRKLWFVADEFGQMGKIPVRPLFEVGRSRGVRCVVATQDLAQLEEIYGAPMVKAIVAMSGTLLVGQTMPGDTAESLCKAFGSREVERTNISTSAPAGGAASAGSSTLSFNREEIALYKPSELASRLGLTPDGKGVRLVLFTGGDAFELVWPHFRMREERAGHVPASWTREMPRALAAARVELAPANENSARSAPEKAPVADAVDAPGLASRHAIEPLGAEAEDLACLPEGDASEADDAGEESAWMESTGDAGQPLAAAESDSAPPKPAGGKSRAAARRVKHGRNAR